MKNFAFVLLCFFMIIISCTKDEIGAPPPQKELSKRPFFTKFWLSKKNHQTLKNDYYATIENDSTIYLFCQELESADSIVPSFEGNFNSVKVYGQEQFSGVSIQDFSKVARYELQDSVGNKACYNVKIVVLNKIPRVDIYTDDGVGITSDTEYVNATIKIGNCPEFGAINSRGKIRGRGNVTWNYAKKPYKIKFSNKQSPFGFPASKEWVLLAEACDRTLLRTAYMCEVSNAANVDFTIRYQHVDLFLNKEYLGTYILTDQIEKAKDRIDIDKDGFIIENDNYYLSEPLWFVTDSINMAFSFKYPDADDQDIIKDDENYNFITSFMNDFEKDLIKLADDPVSNDYLRFTDINSFAKLYLVAELITIYDSNKYYVLKNRTSKLKMYPIWDAEWSLGLWPVSGWGDPPVSIGTSIIWGWGYFSYLLLSRLFIEEVKKEWDKLLDKIPIIKEKINKVAESISLSQSSNFTRWTGSGGQILNVTFDTWEEEVEYINHFFDDRVEWMKSYIDSL